MAEHRLTLQDLIRRRQAERFVGRQDELTRWLDNITAPVDDRKFLFCVHGDAGVGKTFLVRHLATIARGHGFSTGYVDESSYDVPTAMDALTADLAGQGVQCKQSAEKLDAYHRRQRELASDPGAPDGMPSLLAKSAVRIGLRAAGDLPVVGAAVRDVDGAAVSEQVDRLRVYLNRKFRDHEDVRLLLSPTEVLSPVFVKDLNVAAERAPVALFFDTYERTGDFLDPWLLDLLAGRFGDLPANLLLTIAGQHPLDVNRWSDFLGVQTDLPLTVFTDTETRQLLARRGVTDPQVAEVILALSGRLPLLVALLAEGRPVSVEQVGDRSGDAVERFLKWEPDENRRTAARHSALPRRLDAEVFGVATGSEQPDFDWLRRLPFVVEHIDGYRYHDVVRQAMLRFTRRLAPGDWTLRHRALAEHYRTAASGMGLSEKDSWSDAQWRDLTTEEYYHRLCAEGTAALPAALTGFIDAFAHQATTARRWGHMIAQAGIDGNVAALREMGERLSAFSDDDKDSQIRLLTDVLADHSLDDEHRGTALAERGEIHRLAARYDDGLADFNRAIELRPDYAWAIAGRAEHNRIAGHYHEALADFNRAIEIDPNNAWAIGSRGQAHLQAGRYDQAITDFNHAIELSPDTGWILGARGMTHQLMGRYNEAIADLNHAIEIDPEYDWAYARRGETYRQMGRYDEAIADFSRAIQIDPEYAWAIGSRGQANQQAGRYDRAITDLNHAIELSPDTGWILGARGMTHQLMGRYNEAIADLNHAIEIDPNSAWAIARRGETCRLMSRYDDALADFNRAIQIDPEYAWAIGSRGQVHQESGRPEKAIMDFNRALEIEPEQAWIIAQRGETYRLIHRYDNAVADFSRAIEIRPESVAIIGRRGKTYRQMGRYNDALTDLDRAMNMQPDEAWIIAERGTTHRLTGQYAAALEDLSRAREMSRGNGWSWYESALALFAMGDNAEVEQLIRTALAKESAQLREHPHENWRALNTALYQCALGEAQEAQDRIRAILDRGVSVIDVTEAVSDLTELQQVMGVNVDEALALLRSHTDRQT